MDSLSRYTTFGIGGTARRIIVARSRGELIDTDGLILGGGSNVLVSDGGYDGSVVINRYESIELSGSEAIVSSGTRLPYLARFLAERGLGGLEWAEGIPGTVGGAVAMNAGAFGSCVADRILYADVLRGGELLRIPRDGLRLGYRRSAIGDGDVVIAAAFALGSVDPAESLGLCDGYAAIRRAKQPRGRSAGSVFKNPEGMSIAKLIDEAGLKGYTVGGARISDAHANVIINTGGATARDVTDIIHTVKAAMSEIGVAAEEEIVYIGDFG